MQPEKSNASPFEGCGAQYLARAAAAISQVLEAGVDAFEMQHFDCGPAGDGDFDDDDDLDLRDFAAFEACVPASPPLGPPCTPGDMNGDQTLDAQDAGAWVSRANGPDSPVAHEPLNQPNASNKDPLHQSIRANQAAL